MKTKLIAVILITWVKAISFAQEINEPLKSKVLNEV